MDDVIDLVMNDTNKINKAVGRVLMKKCRNWRPSWQRKIYKSHISVGGSKRGIIKEELSRVVSKPAPAAASYAGVTKLPLKIGRKIVAPHDVQKVVLVYPKDEQITDSEVTKKMVK